MIEPAPPSTRRTLAIIVVILAGIATAMVVQEGALGPLLAIALEDQGTRPSISGAVVAAPWLSVAVLAPLAARAFRRFGASATMIAGGMVTAAALGLFPLVPQAFAWIGIAALVGVGLALRWVAGEAWLIAATPPAWRGRAIGVQETLIGISGMVGPVLLIATGTEGARPFLILAALTLVTALLPLLAWALGARGTHEDDFAQLGDGRMAVPLMLPFAAGAIEAGAHSFLPVATDAALLGGLPPVLSAGLFSLGATILQIPTGMLADRMDSMKLRLPAALVTVLAGLAFAASPGGAVAVAAILAMGIGCGAFYILSVLEAARAPSPADAAHAIARIALVYTIGSTLGPLAMGTAIDLVGPPGLGLVAAAAALPTLRRPPNPGTR
jgi:MFS family permease